MAPDLCVCVGWCVLAPLSCVALSPCVNVASAFPRSWLPLSPCLPSCFALLDGGSGFPSPRLTLSPHMRACVGWCACFSKVLPPIPFHCFPCVRLPWSCLLLSSHMGACFGWCLLDGVLRPCVPLRPIGSHSFPFSLIVPLCPIVSHCLPLSPHMCACVGWCVCVPEITSPFVSLVSQLVSLLVFLCGGWFYFFFSCKQYNLLGVVNAF